MRKIYLLITACIFVYNSFASTPNTTEIKEDIVYKTVGQWEGRLDL